jgi:superfamily II DNA or RNA helicase
MARDKIAHGRCLLILSERIDMLEKLKAQIPRSVLLVGETKDRDDIIDNAGIKYDAILSTKIFDEGISCHRLDTLILTCPSNNPAKLEQRIGRIQRAHPDKKDPLIIDLWLTGAIVMAQQNRRLEWYYKNNFPTQKN